MGMSRSSIALLAAALGQGLGASACDGGDAGASGGGAGTFPGGAAGAAGASGGAAGDTSIDPQASCFKGSVAELRDCSEISALVEPAMVLLQASEIAEGARFVALGGDAVLAEVEGDGVERYTVAQVLRSSSATQLPRVRVRTVRWDTSQGTANVHDLEGAVSGVFLPALGGSRGIAAAVVALGCDSARCVLLAALEDEDELVPLNGGELPSAVQPSALAVDRDFEAICAYGDDGLWCYDDDTWTDVLDGARGITEVVLAGGRGFAVTEEGELWALRSSGWQQEEPGFGSPVTTVTMNLWGATAIGSGGEVAVDFVGETPDWHWLCTEASPRSMMGAASSLYEPGLALLVLGDGTSLQQSFVLNEPPEWCHGGELTLGAWTATSIAPCGFASNQLMATGSQLIGLEGPLRCIIVD